MIPGPAFFEGSSPYHLYQGTIAPDKSLSNLGFYTEEVHWVHKYF